MTVTVQIQGTAISRTEVLQRDQARTKKPEAPDGGGDPVDWKSEHEALLDFVTSSLNRYQKFMDRTHMERIARNVQRAIAATSEHEAKQLGRMLQLDLMNAGLATDLLLAERATDGADPQVARQINETAQRCARRTSPGEPRRRTRRSAS